LDEVIEENQNGASK